MFKKMTRRDFLKISSVAAAGAVANKASAFTSYPIARNRRDDTIEIVQWDWNDDSEWEPIIADYESKHSNVHIKRVHFDAGKQIKLDTLELASKEGSLPDIFMTIDLAGTAYMEKFAYAFSQFADFADFTKRFPTPQLDFVEGRNVLGGKAYTAPNSFRSGWWNQIFVNNKVLKDAGVSKLPETSDEFLAACRAVVKASGGKVAGYTLGFSQWATMMFQFFSARDAIVWGFDYRTGKHAYPSNKYYQKMWEFLGQMRDEKLILPESASLDVDSINSLFAEGKAAFTQTGLWQINNWRRTNPNFTDYTVIAAPLFGEKPQYTIGVPPGDTGTPWYMGKTTKHPDQAWEWYKYLHSVDYGKIVAERGNLSIFPEANAAVKLIPALQDYIRLNPTMSRIYPSPSLRNPDETKVNPQGAKPDDPAITSGIFSGQITPAELPAILKKLAEDKDAALAQAIADAKTAGAKVSIDDYIFPDWNPLEDYVQIK